MSDAAYETLNDSCEFMFEVLIDAKTTWDENMVAATSGAATPEEDVAPEEDASPPPNPDSTLMGQLYGWLHELPVLDFNSGKS